MTNLTRQFLNMFDQSELKTFLKSAKIIPKNTGAVFTEILNLHDSLDIIQHFAKNNHVVIGTTDINNIMCDKSVHNLIISLGKVSGITFSLEYVPDDFISIVEKAEQTMLPEYRTAFMKLAFSHNFPKIYQLLVGKCSPDQLRKILKWVIETIPPIIFENIFEHTPQLNKYTMQEIILLFIEMNIPTKIIDSFLINMQDPWSFDLDFFSQLYNTSAEDTQKKYILEQCKSQYNDKIIGQKITRIVDSLAFLYKLKEIE